MEFERATGYGIKPIHQRLGPLPSAVGRRHNKVCIYWEAGRCNRRNCPYLHGELPRSLDVASKKRASVWRNPKTAGKRDSDLPRLDADKDQTTSQVNKLCKDFIVGSSCGLGDECKSLHSWFTGDSFSLLTALPSHQKVITGIVLPWGSDKLYTGSQDNTVRIWDCHSGRCVHTVNLESEVGCMISEGPWIFVGVNNAVRAWNTKTFTDLALKASDGKSPVGRVYALAFDNESLFAAIQDGCILAWKLNDQENSFEPAVPLKGHQRSVVSLVIRGGRLYSGCMDSTIRVWDLTTLRCIETLTGHSSVVMSLLYWDNYLLSCSLDGTVKVWAVGDSGKMEVVYTHCEDHGVLQLYGVNDAQDKPVLLCARNDDTVSLYDLPSFSERGRIFSEQEVRAIARGPDGLFFTGDASGKLRVWKWAAKDVTVAASHR
ncbi:zinc finger CCCH domain-containing protein 17-like [Asparagus officinalis]|uniref:zinc finger CCCH domain-containing protein 17-like n=1 Tax=Asparagus officinalis TaxID=4686 RepID=UPI00098E3EB8|nr:zinc finger CCCH domain-containing protein 17-like [Asparagus officinalis]